MGGRSSLKSKSMFNLSREKAGSEMTILSHTHFKQSLIFKRFEGESCNFKKGDWK